MTSRPSDRGQLMGIARQLMAVQLRRILLTPSFWFIAALLVLITLVQYGETFEQPPLIAQLVSDLGFTRYAFERILYLAPIVWAGFMFGWKGAIAVSLVSLGCMLPRAIFISPSPLDSLLETSAVFVIGNVLAISFSTLRRERKYRARLEETQRELQLSEERFRELFESAYDAIWLHDLEENIIAANKSLAVLTGYTLGELRGLKAGHLIAGGCLHAKEATENLSEATMLKKDGSGASVQLSTNPVFSDGRVVAFQHIARDITQEKRMRENLRSVLKQSTRAQEEERKRISRELHDDTIQSLVVLSRRLDALSSDGGLSKDSSQQLEELWQRTDNIIKGVRRLSQDLRPAALDRLGLVSALEWLTSDVAQFSGVAVDFQVLGEPRRLPEEFELVLFRIVQEALRNVWRHSEATKVEVTVAFLRSNIEITVTDNGKGFNLPETMGDLARDGKLGLAGMQERAQLVGATLTVTSRPGAGVSITVGLPA